MHMTLHKKMRGWGRALIVALMFVFLAAPASAVQPATCPIFDEKDVAELSELGADLDITNSSLGTSSYVYSVEDAALPGGKTINSFIAIAECEPLGTCGHLIDGNLETHTHMVFYERTVTKDNGHGNTLLDDTLLIGATGGTINDSIDLELTLDEWTACFCHLLPGSSPCVDDSHKPRGPR